MLELMTHCVPSSIARWLDSQPTAGLKKSISLASRGRKFRSVLLPCIRCVNITALLYTAALSLAIDFPGNLRANLN